MMSSISLEDIIAKHGQDIGVIIMDGNLLAHTCKSW